MAKPLKPRTELARRLIEARERSRFPTRAELAERLGVPADTLGTYERGVAEPSIELLARYHEITGVNVTWLVSGDGEAFPAEDAIEHYTPKHKLPDFPAIDAVVFQTVDGKVRATFIEFKRSAPERTIFNETIKFYNELAALVPDLRNPTLVDAGMTLLSSKLREKVKNNEYGSGKRSA